VAVTVHEGNVSDSQTFLPEVERLRKEFGIEEVGSALK
jgi:transposase